MAQHCTFTLETGQFSLTLEGDEAFIRDAYGALREEILRRVRPSGVSGTTTELAPIDEASDEADAGSTERMIAPADRERPTEQDRRRLGGAERAEGAEAVGGRLGRDTFEGSPRTGGATGGVEGDFVWVLECDTLYNKVRAVDRASVAATAVGRQVDPGRLHRIFVEAHDAARLRPLLPAGKTLWSELTPLGRQRLRQA